ncbi:hypothetical protein V5R04_04270 [Jonesiaceae bacterium BS-20]|uniref:Uncharacterized protein n=1 Tax=Jonesiaceae bacterium BS-20 TaxID=3120821 RepID=A0AAU7DYT9_9MICO
MVDSTKFAVPNQGFPLKRMIKRRQLAIGGALAIASLLAGCGVDSGAKEDDLSSESFDPTQLLPSTLFPGTYALPLDGIVAPATEDDHVRERAIAQHVAKCMAEEGFEFSSNNTYTQTATKSYYYGITSVQEAAVYGYRRPVELGVDNRDDETPEEDGSGVPSEEAMNGDSEEFVLALNGDQDDWVQVKDETSGAVVANYDPNACWGKAMDELQPKWGQRYALESIAYQIAGDTYLESLNSQVVIDGFAAWSTCMDTKGFDFANPDAAYLSVWVGEVPGQEEIKTAVADAECKESTGLNKIWSGEIARLQTAALNKYPGFVEQWNEILQADLDAARAAN